MSIEASLLVLPPPAAKAWPSLRGGGRNATGLARQWQRSTRPATGELNPMAFRWGCLSRAHRITRTRCVQRLGSAVAFADRSAMADPSPDASPSPLFMTKAMPSSQGEAKEPQLAANYVVVSAGQRHDGMPMKFTLAWLKDHLDTSASVAELAEKLALDRARRRRRRRSGGEARGLHHRPRDRGQAPSQRRQAAGVQGRHGLRRRRGGVRRPQRQDRHDRRVRAHGQLHPRHQDHARGASRARRRLPGHAGARSGSWSCPTTTRVSSSWRPSWSPRSASATPTCWASPTPSSR